MSLARNPKKRRTSIFLLLLKTLALPATLPLKLVRKLISDATASRRVVSVAEVRERIYKYGEERSYQQVLQFSRSFPKVLPSQMNRFFMMQSRVMFDPDYRMVSFNTYGKPLNVQNLAIAICEQLGWSLAGFKPSDEPPIEENVAYPLSVNFGPPPPPR